MPRKRKPRPKGEGKLRLTLELPEDVIRALKGKAGSLGKSPRDLVVEWVRSWPIRLPAGFKLHEIVEQLHREKRRTPSR